MILTEEIDEPSVIVDAKLLAVDYLTNTDDFIRSQKGLENFESDSSLKTNPLYSKFFAQYNKVKSSLNEIKENPKPAGECFNADAAKEYTRLIVEIYSLLIRLKSAWVAGWN